MNGNGAPSVCKATCEGGWGRIGGPKHSSHRVDDPTMSLSTLHLACKVTQGRLQCIPEASFARSAEQQPQLTEEADSCHKLPSTQAEPALSWALRAKFVLHMFSKGFRSFAGGLVEVSLCWQGF